LAFAVNSNQQNNQQAAALGFGNVNLQNNQQAGSGNVNQQNN
jgi:hypothetical protein